ncbi:perforin-1-like [Dendropsophus ebraccatus]|uniref:perforin-1-like n=1 Tax=Dendropsophus ebraccatus TaxID=150705 RepID=UPI003831CD34
MRITVVSLQTDTSAFSAMEPKLSLMFWLLLLFHHHSPSMSLPNLKAGCRSGTAQECKEAKFVPGHTLLGEGINIVNMETTGSFLLDLQEVGEQCVLCNNPHNNDVLQKLPKALVDWRPETSCSRDIQSLVSRSTVSVAEESTSSVQNDWKVGLNLNIVVNVKTALGGSRSQTAKYAESKTVTDNYSFLSQKLECAFYSFRLGSDTSLTPHFQDALEELPESYDSTTMAEYRRLIESFGTHYITHVKVGGRTQEFVAVRQCEVSMSGLKMDEVKDCFAAEASVGISKVSVSSKVEQCKIKLEESGFQGNFHQTFSERVWKVIGGNATIDLLSPDGVTPEVFDKWIESLKAYPGLVSYSLDSIHNLVRMKGSKKENLRLAVSDYIKEKALAQKCSCGIGEVINQGDDCSCTCKASGYTGPDCCPTHRGAARLVLTIGSATNLVPDFWSKADGFVVFKFDKVYVRSKTIDNDNNPTWNERYDLGPVELNPVKPYTIEVWDEDVTYDDLNGRCEKPLSAGDTSETCYLSKGALTYSLSVTCADHLTGRFCQDYVPVPPSA